MKGRHFGRIREVSPRIICITNCMKGRSLQRTRSLSHHKIIVNMYPPHGEFDYGKAIIRVVNEVQTMGKSSIVLPAVNFGKILDVGQKCTTTFFCSA